MTGAQLVFVLIVTSSVLLLALCAALVRGGSWSVLAGMAVLGTVALWAYTHRPLPDRGPCVLPSRAGELGSICGVRNPEDLAYVSELDWIVTAEFEPGGRLLAVRLSDLSAAPISLWPTDATDPASTPVLGDPTCTVAPDPQTFFPHGLSVAAATAERGPLLAAVTHGRSDTLHLFELQGDGLPRAQWRGCIPYPPATTGNDVALLRDGSLVATNFAPEIFGVPGWRYQMRAILGVITGNLLRWSPEHGWSRVPATEGAGPNGVIASADESRFYFSDGGRETVQVGSLGETASGRSAIAIGAPPDNLSISSSGAILATVATFRGELPLLCSLRGRLCRVGWAVLEIDPQSQAITEVVAEAGRQIATATSALEVGPYVFIGTMQDDRIGVYRRR